MITHLKWMQSLPNTLKPLQKAILFISSIKMGWNFACVRHRWELPRLHSFWIFDLLRMQKIIAAGSCGVLTDLDENEFLIPIRAMRDEGTSYHYLPAARFVDLEPSAIKAIEQTFCALNIPFQNVSHGQRMVFPRNTRYGRISQIRGLCHS